MKRVLAMLVSVFIFASLFVVSPLASADDEALFVVSSHKIAAGESADVSISIKNSPGIASAKLLVCYDSDLTLDSVTYDSGLGGFAQAPEALSSPVTLNWVSLSSLNGDAAFATLHFSTAQDISSGVKSVEIVFEADDVCDINEINVPFGTVNGGIDISCPHENTEIRNAKSEGMRDSGYTGDVYCLDCGEIISEGKIIYAFADANTDEEVDIKDLVRLAGFIKNITAEINEKSDINQDGEIEMTDFKCLCDILLELPYDV